MIRFMLRNMSLAIVERMGYSGENARSEAPVDVQRQVMVMVMAGAGMEGKRSRLEERWIHMLVKVHGSEWAGIVVECFTCCTDVPEVLSLQVFL